MVATTPTTIEAPADEYVYELVPLLALPDIDLSISVKSRCFRSRLVHQVLNRASRSPLTFVSYMVSLGVGVAVFYVPVRIGRPLSVVVTLMQLPGALVSIAHLRFDMVAVMAKTYDMWFFSSVSTIVSMVLGLLLNDARSLLMLSLWLSFVINICVDANVLGLRHIWFANIGTIIGFTAMAAAVSVGATDRLRTFDLVRINGHVLPAAAVVRDSLITMIIVIARNVVRKHNHALSQSKTTSASSEFRCVSFRCRLQLRANVKTHNASESNPTIISVQHSKLSDLQAPTAPSRTQLRFKPELPLIDVRSTLVPMRWLWRIENNDTRRLRTPLTWIGALGFIVTNVIYLISVAWPELWPPSSQIPVIIAAAGASTVFIAVTTAAMHRQLLRAVGTSFDFLFIVVEITILHLALADIMQWQLTTVIALLSDWQWCVWILCWDAITPPVRTRLGLTRRFAVCIGPSLIAVLATVVVVVFVIKPPNTITDRIIYRFQLFDRPIEFRALTWYFSCAATISSWAVRIMWRICMASETELVVLDGSVVYENRRRVRSRVSPTRP